MCHEAFKKIKWNSSQKIKKKEGKNPAHGEKDFRKSINDEDKLNRPNSAVSSQ